MELTTATDVVTRNATRIASKPRNSTGAVQSMTRAFRQGLIRLMDAQERRARLHVSAYLAELDAAQLREIGYSEPEIEEIVELARKSRR